MLTPNFSHIKGNGITTVKVNTQFFFWGGGGGLHSGGKFQSSEIIYGGQILIFCIISVDQKIILVRHLMRYTGGEPNF